MLLLKPSFRTSSRFHSPGMILSPMSETAEAVLTFACRRTESERFRLIQRPQQLNLPTTSFSIWADKQALYQDKRTATRLLMQQLRQQLHVGASRIAAVKQALR